MKRNQAEVYNMHENPTNLHNSDFEKIITEIHGVKKA